MRKGVKNKKLLLISLMMIFLFSLLLTAAAAENESGTVTAVQPQKIFADVEPSNPNAAYINYLSYKNIINGYPDGTFQPGEGLTRAQAATVIVKAAGLQAPAENNTGFSDVAAEHWAAGNIAAAARAGYIKGYPDGTYHPEEQLTRAQGIALLMRLSQQTEQAELPELSDMDKSHWAAREMGTAIAAEMIDLPSDGKVYPEAMMNRGSLARALGTLLTRDPGLYSTELKGSLKEIKGKIELIRNGESSRITEETTVYPGDQIKVGRNSSARLVYPDGSGTLIKENSQIGIEEARGREYIKKDGSPGIAIDWLNIKLQKGTLFGALASKQKKGSEKQNAGIEKQIASLNSREYIAEASNNQNLPWYQTAQTKKVKMQVDMPWGVAAIRGTFIRVTVREDGSCDVSCLTGDAEMIGQDEEGNPKAVPLGEGQSSGIGDNQAVEDAKEMSEEEKEAFEEEQGWVVDTALEMDAEQKVIPGQAESILDNVIEALENSGAEIDEKTKKELEEKINKVVEELEQEQQTGEEGNNPPAGDEQGGPAGDGSGDNEGDGNGGGGSGGGSSSGGSDDDDDDDDASISSIASINASISQGESYQLPATVTAVMSDSTSRTIAVSWTPANADTSTAGTYTFSGTVAGYEGTVNLTLVVENKLGEAVSIKQGEPIILAGGIKIDLGNIAVPEGATVNVEEINPTEIMPGSGENQLQVAGQIIDINFSNMNINQPVELVLSVQSNIDTSKAGIYYYNNGNWEYQPTTVENGKLKAMVSHFSTYGVLADTSPPYEMQIEAGEITADTAELIFSAKDNTTVEKYEIYRDSELITSTNENSYTDSGLEKGKTYSYNLKAIDKFNNEALSGSIEIKIQSNQKDILSFTLAEQTQEAIIDTENHSIELEVAKGTDISKLKPEIQISENAIIEPQSGEEQDFSQALIYTVTAEDESQQEWTITVNVEKSNNADLQNIEITATNEEGQNTGQINLNETIDPETNNYTGSVDKNINSLNINITAADPEALISINGAEEQEQSATAEIELQPGTNSITIQITAEDGTTIKDYSISIEKALKSSNAYLSSLAISSGTLSPAFDKEQSSYSSSVSYSVSSTTVTAVPEDSTATVAIEGTQGNTKTIPLSVGSNNISITVTAEDGSRTKSYSISIERAQAPPPPPLSSNANLSSINLEYCYTTTGGDQEPFYNHICTFTIDTITGNMQVGAPPNTDSVAIFAYPQDSAEASVDIRWTNDNETWHTAVWSWSGGQEHIDESGTEPACVLFSGSQTTTMEITVTAENGTQKIYILNVSPEYNSYTVQGPGGGEILDTLAIPAPESWTTVQCTVLDQFGTDFTESVTWGVNGTYPDGSVTISGGLLTVYYNAEPGPITITGELEGISVTAEINLVNINLSSLGISQGTLSPAFAPAATSYTAGVGNEVDSITVTPTAADSNAAITVNGTPVTSGTSSSAISLAVGDNPINVVVTAEDGVTTRTYAVTVNRADIASVVSPADGDFFNLSSSISGTAIEAVIGVKIAIQDSSGKYFNNTNEGYWATGVYWMDTVSEDAYDNWSIDLSGYLDSFTAGEYSISIKANDGADHIISNVASFMVEGMVLSQYQHSFSGDDVEIYIDVYSLGIQEWLKVGIIKDSNPIGLSIPVSEGLNCQVWGDKRAEGIPLNIAGGNAPYTYTIKAITDGECSYTSTYNISPGWARRKGDVVLAGVDTGNMDIAYDDRENLLYAAYRDSNDGDGKYSVMNMTYADGWSDEEKFAPDVGQISMYLHYYEVPEPYIAYTESTSSAGYVAYNNGSWQKLTEDSFGSVGSDLDIYTDSSYDNNILIAYSDDDNSKGTVKKFVNDVWSAYPISGDSTFSAGAASQISWDSSGGFLTCIDAGSGGKAVVKKEGTTAWVDAGTTTGGAISVDAAEYPSLAMGNIGLYVGYKDLGASGKATVMGNMDGWTMLGSRGFTPGTANHLQVEALHESGEVEIPFVIFSDGNAGGKATVMKYVYGSDEWVPAGDTGFSDNAVNYGRLFNNFDDQLYAVYGDSANNELKVRRYVTLNSLEPLSSPSPNLAGSTLSWGSVVNAEAYRVKLYDSSTGMVLETGEVGAGTTSYTFENEVTGESPITVQALGDRWNYCDSPEVIVNVEIPPAS